MIYIYIYVCVYIYIYIYLFMFTYTHTHTQYGYRIAWQTCSECSAKASLRVLAALFLADACTPPLSRHRGHQGPARRNPRSTTAYLIGSLLLWRPHRPWDYVSGTQIYPSSQRPMAPPVHLTMTMNLLICLPNYLSTSLFRLPSLCICCILVFL